MKNTYYMLTCQENKNILVIKNIEDCYVFILNNKDTKIRTLDYKAKPKILDRRRFLENYYKDTGESNKLFELAKIMIKGRTNLSDFFRRLKLSERYRNYNQEKHQH